MMRNFLVLLTILFVGVSCSSPSSTYTTYVYTPRFAVYSFTLNSRWKISHEYLDFNKIGEPQIGGCNYGYANSTIAARQEGIRLAGDMFEKDGHIFQLARNYTNNSIMPIDMDRKVLGRPYTSELGAGNDANGKPLPVVVNQVTNFDTIAYDRIGGVSYCIYLQKSSSSSIVNDINETKKLLDTAWKECTRWESEFHVQRGTNNWICFKHWNRCNYLGDSSESWYLPIGDGAYYYKVCFTYQSEAFKTMSEEYVKGRAIFDRILDSFKIEEIK